MSGARSSRQFVPHGSTCSSGSLKGPVGKRRSGARSSAQGVRSLTSVPEMYVITNAINRLHALLVDSLLVEKDARLTEVPRKLLSWAFLHRLLNNDIMLKNCKGNDLSGAQRDLRHLSLEQLIYIRRSTLDFSTESESHSSHCNFLRTVELHLFEKLAQRCLRGDVVATSLTNAQLYSLGYDIAMVLGASDILAQKQQGQCVEDNPQDTASSSSPLLWGFMLDPGDWPEQVAFFHISGLWTEVFSRDHLDFTSVAAGSPVCVVCDRTTGSGKSRLFDADFIVLDPCVDDVVSEMSRVDKRVQSRIVEEMEEAQRKRASQNKCEAIAPISSQKVVVRERIPSAEHSVLNRVQRLEALKKSPEKPEKTEWKLGEDKSPPATNESPVALSARANEPPVFDRSWLQSGDVKEERKGCGLFCCPSALGSSEEGMQDFYTGGKQPESRNFFDYFFCCCSNRTSSYRDTRNEFDWEE